MAMRWRWPPEKACGYRDAACSGSRPTRLQASPRRLPFAIAPRRPIGSVFQQMQGFRDAAADRVWRGSSEPNGSWNTICIRARRRRSSVRGRRGRTDPRPRCTTVRRCRSDRERHHEAGQRGLAATALADDAEDLAAMRPSGMASATGQDGGRVPTAGSRRRGSPGSGATRAPPRGGGRRGSSHGLRCPADRARSVELGGPPGVVEPVAGHPHAFSEIERRGPLACAARQFHRTAAAERAAGRASADRRKPCRGWSAGASAGRASARWPAARRSARPYRDGGAPRGSHGWDRSRRCRRHT
jgi:hypothetical protein